MLSCDVLVVGAGPAGSTTARVAAEAGANVIVVERRPQVGVPVQCAGWVSAAIRIHRPLSDDYVVQTVDALRTVLLDGSVQNVHEVPAPGYILDRARFDSRLAEDAVRAGAQLLLGTTAVAPSSGGLPDGLIVQHAGERQVIHARVIVGADGPRSTIAHLANQPSPRWAMGLQYEVGLCQPLSAGLVQFRAALPGGYGWLFPAGEHARVGVAGLVGTPTCRAELNSFLQELFSRDVVFGTPVRINGGLIPVGPPRARVSDNVILVGDAANHNHAITGAGIINGIVAGEIAGQSAAKAALSGDLSQLDEYVDEVGSVLNPVLEKALVKHARLEAHWGADSDTLSGILRECWIGFEAYFRT